MDSSYSADLIAAWQTAARGLQIRVITPFFIPTTRGDNWTLFAYLPDFGSEKGMLLDVISSPDFTGDELALRFARENGVFYTAINEAVYSTFDHRRFTEMLNDAGFFGQQRPDWLAPVCE